MARRSVNEEKSESFRKQANEWEETCGQCKTFDRM